MSSLRTPSATVRPAYCCNAGRSATTEAGICSVEPPNSSSSPSPARLTFAVTRFIGGEPTNCATNMLSGVS